MAAHEAPTWYKDAVFYELYVRAFKDGNGDGHGDLQGLLSKLDYLQELGIDCIWLLPVYPSPLVDDGYDVADYRGVHEDYGTLEDFKAVIEGAHERGMHIIVDIVLNHTSDQHPWFTASRTSTDSPMRNWYVWSRTDQLYQNARVIFLDTESSNWTYDSHTGEYYWHRFFSAQPDLNYDSPAVQQEMLDIIDFWMELGLDGFRVDAVPYLFEREGTNCENLAETHQYVKRMRAHVDSKWPGRLLLAEANQWPEDVRAYFGDDDEFQMAFHFPIMPRLFMALKQQRRTSIVDIINRTPPIPPLAQWCIFLRNHDELTLEMVTEEERRYMWDQYAPESRMRINLGIRRRLAPLLDNDRRRIELLNAMLFTLPGSPIIYYGDEIGMGDDIWLDDRDGVRTPMQWDDSKDAGFSEADHLYAPVIDDDVFGYQHLNVKAQRADSASLWHTMRHMLDVRRKFRAFGRGTFTFALPPAEEVLGYWRVYRADGEDRLEEHILVLANLSDEPQEFTLDLGSYVGIAPKDLLTGEEWPVAGSDAYAIKLAPYGYHWLSLSPESNRS
ncbi:maltose alpha-D-glucosyltransferase [Aggregatilinea lenta]|uniref:maltose alpha-D-glucosyltransferase n=1 Tax=Aggregatilinea lenta TaxID=913108 RepID=UPI000E5A368B|nr:maltose alpha-D-glucosyltransferase [Aggregatilinea lenta]